MQKKVESYLCFDLTFNYKSLKYESEDKTPVVEITENKLGKSFEDI